MKNRDLKNGQDKNVGRYLEAFGDFERSLNGAADPGIRERRKAAMTRFAEKGFPTLKDEAWRYTSVKSLANTEMTAAVNRVVEQEDRGKDLFGKQGVKISRR